MQIVLIIILCTCTGEEYSTGFPTTTYIHIRSFCPASYSPIPKRNNLLVSAWLTGTDSMQTSYIRISTPRPLLSRIPVCIPSTKPFRKGMPFSVPQASRLAPWKKKKKSKKKEKNKKGKKKTTESFPTR